ncbi:MAG: MarR family transcriptional regulator [bacterium]
MDLSRLPKDEELLAFAQRTKGSDAGAIETLLVLQGAANAVNRALERFLARYGISPARFFVLLLLLDAPDGRKPSEIANGMGVRKATITGLLEGLEGDGLVRRVPDSRDRRAFRIHPTQVARGLMEGVLKEYYRHVGAWFGGVSGGGRRTIEGVLASIVEKIPETPTDEALNSDIDDR